MNTFLIEIEAILNNRPLTALSDDPKDFNVLTPNHFLIGQQSLPFVTKDKELNFRNRWKSVEALSNMFWKRFSREYVPLLNARKKWGREVRNFQVNDLVLLKQEGQHRSLWSVARVIDVNIGKDGIIRSVKLQMPNSILVRPVNSIVLLEGTK